jgi:hypothetical protein
MSIAFSPTSADIELYAGEESGGDLTPIEATGKPCTDDVGRSFRVVCPNCGFCQLANRGAQSRRGRDSSERSLRAKQLVVPTQGSLGRIAYHGGKYSNRATSRLRIVRFGL